MYLNLEGSSGSCTGEQIQCLAVLHEGIVDFTMQRPSDDHIMGDQLLSTSFSLGILSGRWPWNLPELRSGQDGSLTPRLHVRLNEKHRCRDRDTQNNTTHPPALAWRSVAGLHHMVQVTNIITNMDLWRSSPSYLLYILFYIRLYSCRFSLWAIVFFWYS